MAQENNSSKASIHLDSDWGDRISQNTVKQSENVSNQETAEPVTTLDVPPASAVALSHDRNAGIALLSDVRKTKRESSVINGLPSDEENRKSSQLTGVELGNIRISMLSNKISSPINDKSSPSFEVINESVMESNSITSVGLPPTIVESEKSLTYDTYDITRSTTAEVSVGEPRRMSHYRRSSVKNFIFRRDSRIIQECMKNPLEDLDNTQLVNTVNELQKTARYLELENKVLLNFLQKNDPSLLGGMNTILEIAQGRTERGSITAKRLTRLSIMSKRASNILYGYGSEGSSISAPTAAEKEGPRINITQKTDLILREMEAIKNSVEMSTKRFQIAKHKLKAQLEEMSIRESEIRDTWNLFESVFITGTIEKYTQKINPADKFIRFMEEWFTKSRLALDKIRLRTSSLLVQYQKVCHQLIQKQLLGENLQIVDFEQLQIENQHLLEKIDHRNLLLLELKNMNGKANLLLSKNKKQLFAESNYLKKLKNDISFKEEATTKFDLECEKISIELEATKDEYDKIKTRTETYEVPEVIDYVKKKAELGTVKKNLKIWGRRRQIQDMALAASIREMKIFTNTKTPASWWFKDPRETHIGKNSLGSTFEFAFQQRRQSTVIPRFNSRKLRKRSLINHNIDYSHSSDTK